MYWTSVCMHWIYRVGALTFRASAGMFLWLRTCSAASLDVSKLAHAHTKTCHTYMYMNTELILSLAQEHTEPCIYTYTRAVRARSPRSDSYIFAHRRGSESLFTVIRAFEGGVQYIFCFSRRSLAGGPSVSRLSNSFFAVREKSFLQR
jgi:hypothetical protein